MNPCSACSPDPTWIFLYHLIRTQNSYKKKKKTHWEANEPFPNSSAMIFSHNSRIHLRSPFLFKYNSLHLLLNTRLYTLNSRHCDRTWNLMIIVTSITAFWQTHPIIYILKCFKTHLSLWSKIQNRFWGKWYTVYHAIICAPVSDIYDVISKNLGIREIKGWI